MVFSCFRSFWRVPGQNLVLWCAFKTRSRAGASRDDQVSGFWGRRYSGHPFRSSWCDSGQDLGVPRKTVQTSGARQSPFSLAAVSVQREAALSGYIHLRTCQSLFFALHNQLRMHLLAPTHNLPRATQHSLGVLGGSRVF